MMRKMNYVVDGRSPAIGCSREPITTSPLSWLERFSCVFGGDATLTNVDPNKSFDSSLFHASDEENQLCNGL